MDSNKMSLLDKLQKGRNIYGTCITSTGPMWPAAIKTAGLDFVFIDTEHIPLDRHEQTLLCHSFKSLDIEPIVRIPSPDPYKACQAIDGGAAGIVVPYVESPAQIIDLIGAVKYRPLKGDLLYAYLSGRKEMTAELKGYIEAFNRDKLCIANIESVPAIERLDEILSVPGLDGVFIGPHDLSVSLGLPEQYDHPVFENAVKKIIQTTRAKGLHIGIHFSLEPERQVKWIREGVNIIVHSFDIALFVQRLKYDLHVIKSAVSDGSNSVNGDKLVI